MSRVPGKEVFGRFAALLADLGFKVGKPDWVHGCMATAPIRFGRRTVAELDFAAMGDHLRLFVHPVGSMKITGGAGRICDLQRLDAELDDIESLFRTWLVMNGKMDFDDYPTDMALKAWIWSLAEKQGSGQPIGDRCVAVAREIVARPFDRSKALKFHAVAAEFEVPFDEDGRWTDVTAGIAQQGALGIAETKYARQALAWKDGSSMAFLHLRERPEPPERAVAVAPTPAPSPAMR